MFVLITFVNKGAVKLHSLPLELVGIQHTKTNRVLWSSTEFVESNNDNS